MKRKLVLHSLAYASSPFLFEVPGVVGVERVVHDVDAELVRLVRDFLGGAGVPILPGVVDVARVVEDGPAAVDLDAEGATPPWKGASSRDFRKTVSVRLSTLLDEVSSSSGVFLASRAVSLGPLHSSSAAKAFCRTRGDRFAAPAR